MIQPMLTNGIRVALIGYDYATVTPLITVIEQIAQAIRVRFFDEPIFIKSLSSLLIRNFQTVK